MELPSDHYYDQYRESYRNFTRIIERCSTVVITDDLTLEQPELRYRAMEHFHKDPNLLGQIYLVRCQPVVHVTYHLELGSSLPVRTGKIRSFRTGDYSFNFERTGLLLTALYLPEELEISLKIEGNIEWTYNPTVPLPLEEVLDKSREVQAEDQDTLEHLLWRSRRCPSFSYHRQSELTLEGQRYRRVIPFYPAVPNQNLEAILKNGIVFYAEVMFLQFEVRSLLPLLPLVAWSGKKIVELGRPVQRAALYEEDRYIGDGLPNGDSLQPSPLPILLASELQAPREIPEGIYDGVYGLPYGRVGYPGFSFEFTDSEILLEHEDTRRILQLYSSGLTGRYDSIRAQIFG